MEFLCFLFLVFFLLVSFYIFSLFFLFCSFSFVVSPYLLVKGSRDEGILSREYTEKSLGNQKCLCFLLPWLFPFVVGRIYKLGDDLSGMATRIEVSVSFGFPLRSLFATVTGEDVLVVVVEVLVFVDVVVIGHSFCL